MKRLHYALLIILAALCIGAFAVDGVDNPEAVDGVDNPATVEGVEGTTNDVSNITFFWRMEQTDGNFSSTNGTLDYSAGDDTAIEQSSADINAGASMGPGGSYGGDFPGAQDYYEFNADANTINLSTGTVCFHTYTTTHVAWTEFFKFRNGSADGWIYITMHINDLRLTVDTSADDGTTETTGNSWGTGTEYVVVGAWDQGNDKTFIGFYNAAFAEIDSEETVDSFDLMNDYDELDFGNATDNAGDVHVDHVVMLDIYDVARCLEVLQYETYK